MSSISPEDLVQHARHAYTQKDYRVSADLFDQAAEQYQAQADILMAAEMKNNCSVAWLQAGDAHKALLHAEGTEQIFANAGDVLHQAMAIGNQASALEALEKRKEAIEKYQLASDLLKDSKEKELRSYVLKRLAGLQLRTGDQLQSLATMHAALEGKNKLNLRERLLKKLLKIPFKLTR